MKRSAKKRATKTTKQDEAPSPAGGWPVCFHIPDDAKIKTIPTPPTEQPVTGKYFWSLPDMRTICESGAGQ